MASPLIEHSKSGFRTWFRKVWEVRGGGLSLADDVLGIGALFRGEAVQFFINLIVESLTNTLSALMWPISVIQLAPPFGLIGLAITFWLFPTYVKPHIESWLFDGEPVDESKPSGDGDAA